MSKDGQPQFGVYRYEGGSSVRLELSAQDYTESAVWHPLAEVDVAEGTQPLAPGQFVGRIEKLTIEVWNDIDLDAQIGVTIMAGGAAAVASPGDLPIDSLTAGGAVRLQAGGALFDRGTVDLALGELTAIAGTGICLSQVKGPLIVRQATTIEGDIRFEIPDSAVPGTTWNWSPAGRSVRRAGRCSWTRATMSWSARTAASWRGRPFRSRATIKTPIRARVPPSRSEGRIYAPTTTITAGGDGNAFVLTNVVPGNVTTVQTGGGGDLVQVGQRLSDIQGRLILHGEDNEDRLILRDGDDQATGGRRIGQLTSDRIRGFGMPADAWIEYVGFSGTATEPGLDIQLFDPDGYELTVFSTSVPTHLAFGEGNHQVVFDASSQTAPIPEARLYSEGDQLHLSNLGPIDAVSVSGGADVALELGAGDDLLEMDVSLADVRIDVHGHGGDDLIFVQAIGHTTIIDGGAGFDQVQVEILGDPTGPDHHKLFEHLVVTAETLIVDNSSHAELVHWTLSKTANVLRAEDRAVLCTEGVDTVHLVAGESSGSTLAVEGLDGPVILDGNQIELTANAPVLTPGDYLNDGFTYTLGTLVGVTDVATYGDFVYTASPGNDTVGVFLRRHRGPTATAAGAEGRSRRRGGAGRRLPHRRQRRRQTRLCQRRARSRADRL
jgi:hypothetical protein